MTYPLKQLPYAAGLERAAAPSAAAIHDQIVLGLHVLGDAQHHQLQGLGAGVADAAGEIREAAGVAGDGGADDGRVAGFDDDRAAVMVGAAMTTQFLLEESP